MTTLPPEVANNPALLRLYHKQQEYSGLQALKEATEGMLSKANTLAEQSNMMADGGEAIGRVLQHWTYVQHILDQMKRYADTGEDEQPEPLPQMVRLAYTGEGEAVQQAAKEAATPRKQ
ncbi:unnamed protein product [Cutaneotrichosporon oleaginosum]